MTEEQILEWYEKYKSDFGLSKPQCLPVSIPSAWNRGKSRSLLYYTKCSSWGHWFDKYDRYLKHIEIYGKELIQETHVYEIER